jgi:hypothetical protein|tara:strand:+ start:1022 stop:1225 length:204 start_codon:yes stop_codon:yes gene_type:complete
MSGEQLTAKELNRKSEDLTFRKSSLRVDINDLTSRARQRNKKEKRENYIFLGLVLAVVVVTGVVASL